MFVKKGKHEGMERAVAKDFRRKLFEASWHSDLNLHLRRTVLLKGICLKKDCVSEGHLSEKQLQSAQEG